MAKLTIKITQTGEEFEIEDVDLSQLTPRQLIDEMINHGLLLAESIAPYGIIDKNGLMVKVYAPHLQNWDLLMVILSEL